MSPALRKRRYWSEAHLFHEDGAPVVVQQHRREAATALHRHEFTELVLVLDGTGWHEVDGGRHALVPGDWFVIEGARAHAYREPRGLNLINILIPGWAMRRLRPLLRPLRGYARLFPGPADPFPRQRPLLPGELDGLVQRVRRMEAERARMEDGYPAALLALLTELLVTACRHAGSAADAGAQRSRIGQLLAHLERHSAETIPLAQMETIAGMSPRTLQRHFRAVTRTTPRQYLLHLRMAHACRLLRETDAKIADLAAQCGVPDGAYFSRLFRQMNGEGPRAYRRRMGDRGQTGNFNS